MPNQELERDQLFRVLAIQLGLLDATRLEWSPLVQPILMLEPCQQLLKKLQQ